LRIALDVLRGLQASTQAGDDDRIAFAFDRVVGLRRSRIRIRG
jgi:hypothetical protein